MLCALRTLREGYRRSGPCNGRRRNRPASRDIGKRCREGLACGAVIENAQKLRLQHEDLAGIGDAQLLAGKLQIIVHDRDRIALRRRLGGNRRPIIREARVQHQELKARMLLAETFKRLRGSARACIAIHLCHQHDGLDVSQPPQALRIAGVVDQAEIIGAHRDLGRARLAVGCRGQGQESEGSDRQSGRGGRKNSRAHRSLRV